MDYLELEILILTCLFLTVDKFFNFPYYKVCSNQICALMSFSNMHDASKDCLNAEKSIRFITYSQRE